MNLMVLREIVGLNPMVERNLDANGQIIERQDGSKWVNNDHPFDSEISGQLVAATGRFAVADEYGGIVGGPYRSLVQAESARAGAKVTIATEFDVDEADDEVPAKTK